jgi:protocatechuate 3,4-dioxygenase beta subunit
MPDPTITRRAALGVLGAGGLFAVGYKLAVAGGDDTAAGAAPTSAGSTVIPEETGGPYPADGSNGPDVLADNAVVRSDITTSFGELSGTAEGIPLRIELQVVEAGSGDPLPGAAVYLWHCTREGGYSLYSEGLSDQNFLRGVQAADGDGRLAFDSIFPAAYDGRWPHIHFEVYEQLDGIATADPVTTSQLALPEDVCSAVYATEGYEASVDNLARTSLQTDMVFSDGVDQQTPTISGSIDEGFVASLLVPVSP